MTIAILGLGIIGAAWARNLIADGLEVRCWNRTVKEFPNYRKSAAEAADGADVIIIVVADPGAVESVLGQILPVLHEGQVVVQSSTISARWSREFAAKVTATSALFLEAPFTGSKPAAEQRKTVYYLGGEKAAMDKALPVLERLSSAILHVGPVGSASSLKLAMNVNIAGVAQTLCESLALARAEGISDETYFEALKLNASRSGVSELKEPKLREGDYSPQFSVKHMAKDLRLARETAQDDKLRLSQMESLLLCYEQAVAKGWSDDDFIGLMRLFAQL